MERNFFARSDSGDLLDGEEDAGFVIGPEQRDNGGVGGDGLIQVCRIKGSTFINREPGDLIATGCKIFAEFDGGAMLDGRGDDVALVRVNRECRQDRRVGCLGAAAIENNLGGSGSDKCGNPFTGCGQCGGRTTAKTVDARGIPKFIFQPGQHGGTHFGIDRRGGIVVEIEQVGHGW